MTQQKVLIVDDEPDIRALLEITLMRMGLETQSTENISLAKQFLEEETYDLCLTDMNLPDGNGIEFVEHVQQIAPNMPIAMITAYGSVETAISALKAGAFDFISKPVDLSHLRDVVSSAIKLSDAPQEKNPLEKSVKPLLLGKSPLIMQLNAQVAKLARSQAPIYISGESGSGKELVARAIHNNGSRANGPFIPVNCGAIPNELMESEFFGHVKGSFTGANEHKPGLFMAASGGTLFLDEVADLPLDMQVKLLRAIQEKSVRAVGAHEEKLVDIRILSATHKNLQQLVDEGSFRQDLFYRINVITLQVPSLRDRRGDIALLANRFLEDIAKDCGVKHASIDQEALSALNAYGFPGNVRELENIIERAFTLCEGNTIREADLQLDNSPRMSSVYKAYNPPATRASAVDSSPQTKDEVLFERQAGQSLEDFLEKIERAEIEKALQETKWNRTAAAKLLGVSFRALRYRLKKLGLD